MKAPPRSRGHQTLYIRKGHVNEICSVIQAVGIYSDTPLKYEIYSEGRRFGSFITSPIAKRPPEKEFSFLAGDYGDFWVDIENDSDEEVEFWYQIQGCWKVDRQYVRSGRSEEEIMDNYIRTGFPSVNFKANKILTEEERAAKAELGRIECQKKAEEQDKATEECEDLLTQLEGVMSHEEIDELEEQITQTLREHDISFFHFSDQVDTAKNRVRNHLEQQAQEQAWSELATEIGIENANGIKNGNYYVFQGENDEWFAIGGNSNELYNLDREERYCITVQSKTRIPVPDQILAKVMWAKNDVRHLLEIANVIGGLNDKLKETKAELVASKHLSIRDLIKNLGKR